MKALNYPVNFYDILEVFKQKNLIELHLNLNTTVSINTVNLFIHCTISIVYIASYHTEFQNLGGGGEYSRAHPLCMKPCIVKFSMQYIKQKLYAQNKIKVRFSNENTSYFFRHFGAL